MEEKLLPLGHPYEWIHNKNYRDYMAKLWVTGVPVAYSAKAEKPVITAKTKVFMTNDLLINKKVRTVTVALVIDSSNIVRAGYSVLNEGDEFNKELGKTISLGRALNDKTNLFNDKYYDIGAGLEKDYGRLFLKHLAEVVLRDIQANKYQIKGIK